MARTRRHGTDVVVVVSAMGKETDELVHLAHQVSSTRPGREMDMLLTVGERKSMALLCMALADIGVAAASFTGSQAGIITDIHWTQIALTGAEITFGGVAVAAIASYVTLRLYVRL